MKWHADEILSVVQNSDMQVFRILKKFRDEREPDGPEDITGWVIRFSAKRHVTDSDAGKLFDIAATIVDAPNGVYRLDLTPIQTHLIAGTYFGEIRWWTAAPAAGEPPADRRSVDYVIQAAIGAVA